MNHTRALARLAGPGRGRGEARRGRAGGARARARPDVQVRCDVMSAIPLIHSAPEH